MPAYDHFELADAKRLIEQELEELHRALALERWCDELGFEKINPLAGRMLKSKLTQNYREETAVMNAPAAELEGLLGPQERETLKVALKTKGITHPNLK